MTRTFKLNLLIALGLLLAVLALAVLIHAIGVELEEYDIDQFQRYNPVQTPEFYRERADMFSTDQHIFIRGYLTDVRFTRYDQDTWLMLASMDKEVSSGVVMQCNMIGELPISDESQVWLPEDFQAVPVELTYERSDGMDRIVRCRSIGSGACFPLNDVLAQADAFYLKGQVQSFRLEGKQIIPD